MVIRLGGVADLIREGIHRGDYHRSTVLGKESEAHRALAGNCAPKTRAVTILKSSANRMSEDDPV